MAVRGGTYNRGTTAMASAATGGNRRHDIAGRPLGQEMSESQVTGFLGRKIYQAMNDEDGDLSDVRQENLNLYIGAEQGDEREGYSQFITREALETIEWMLPSVLRVFLSGENVVTFDAEGPEDEAAAKQETDIVNHFVMKGNNGKGFISFHHWLKDAMMFPNGYIKCWIEEAVKTDVGVVKGVNAMGLQKLMEDEDTEILEQESRMVMVEMPAPPAQPGMSPQAATIKQPLEVFDLKIRTTKDIKKLRVDPVPGEECLVDNDLTETDLDEADFVCHRVRKSFTQLVLEGYDPDELDQVGIGEDYQWNDERTNRLFYEDEDPDAQDEDDTSMRTFWVHECYAWFDYNGDGVAEFRRVVLIGDRVFENVEVNYQPMVAMSSILMQHKHNGMSIIDIVKDLQVLSTVLTRQMLDNIYKINIRKKFFSEDSLTDDGSTMEAMLNTQAEYVPVRGPAVNAVVPEPTHSLVGELLPVMEYANKAKSVRTGVSPQTSLDPNVLQQANTGAFMGALEQASQRIEMLVRIFAETGMRQLMCKAHQQLRTHWDIPKTLKLRGEWVDVDPQGWRDRTDMTVNTGLGFNNRDTTQQLLTRLLAIQKEAMQAGLTNPKKIYNTLDRLVTASNLGDTNQFFVDPSSPEYKPPQPPPDPNMILAQANAKALGEEQQRKKFEAQNKAQIDGQKMQMEAMSKQQQLQDDAMDRDSQRAVKDREMSLKERETMAKFDLEHTRLPEEMRNLDADTRLKIAKAGEADASEKTKRVEATEAYQQAKEIVEGENNGGSEESAEE